MICLSPHPSGSVSSGKQLKGPKWTSWATNRIEEPPTHSQRNPRVVVALLNTGIVVVAASKPPQYIHTHGRRRGAGINCIFSPTGRPIRVQTRCIPISDVGSMSSRVQSRPTRAREVGKRPKVVLTKKHKLGTVSRKLALIPRTFDDDALRWSLKNGRERFLINFDKDETG